MKIKVAITQMSCSTKSEENIAKAIYNIKKAVNDGAKIVLLQELFENQYFCQIEDYNNFDLAHEGTSNAFIKKFQEVAKELDVVLPISYFEKSGNNYYNSLAMIDATGKNLGIYRKMHIPTGQCYEEKFYFTPGDLGYKVFKTKYGKIGIGICWDQWFPEVARILTLKGAQIICYPTAIGSEPILVKDSMPHWRATMCGHAAANIIPVIASNRVGKETARNSEMIFQGYSFIADQHGQVVEELNRTEEGYKIHEFDFDEIDKERIDWGVFRDRRIGSYKPIIKHSKK